MEFKGTTGPWYHSTGDSLTETIGGAISGDGKTLCLVLGKGIGKEKATANAKLMAAAPDLLEALQVICFFDDIPAGQREVAQKAINKALGVNE